MKTDRKEILDFWFSEYQEYFEAYMAAYDKNVNNFLEIIKEFTK